MRKAIVVCFVLVLLGGSGIAEVRVLVEDAGGDAVIKYACTAGEVVRAFPLDVSVSQGAITGVTGYFSGESTAGSQGYGIFPSAFRDHLIVDNPGNVDFNVTGYTPVATPTTTPGDTLPGLGSDGVTLEFMGLWDPGVPAAVPAASGTLCTLHLSQGATVSVSGNSARGGVRLIDPDEVVSTVFIEAQVGVSLGEILSVVVSNGVLTTSFSGGELMSATDLDGTWSGTGDTDGEHTKVLGSDTIEFFRVQGQ